MYEVNTTVNHEALLEQLNKEKIIENIPTMIFICIILVFGIIGNVLTIMFYRTKKQTNSTLLITVLAIVDLLTCFILFNQIISIRYTLTLTSPAACKILVFLSYLFLTSSVLIMFLICIERHRKLCRPFEWQFSPRSCKWTIAVLIAVANLWSARTIPVVTITTHNLTTSDGYVIQGRYCENTRDEGLSDVATYFHTIDTALIFIIITLFVILYLHIGRSILNSRKKLKESSGIPQGVHTIASATNFHDVVVETRNNKASFHEGGRETSDEVKKQKNQDGESNTCDEQNFRSNDLNNKDMLANKKANIHKTERKMTLISCMITLGYILSFIPHFSIVLYVQNVGMEFYELKALMQIVLRSFVFNCAINPYIIGYFNSEFRTYIKEIVCKSWNCFK